jgi:2-polyprenyl-6-methoxyphenol hydroxylase-like FAD-dependent oxidoreductase
MRDRVGELSEWDAVKLLTVLVDHLREWWRPGLLCIGDAAHAMSPVGGIGINLAIQDAVAAANLLSVPLRQGRMTLDDLRAVQRRREFPTRMTQRLQVFIHTRVLSRVLARTPTDLPLVVKLVERWPILRRIPARVVGVGFRPEHVASSIVKP